MSIKVRHAVPSQRLHFRVTVPITIAINGIEYRALDWSISGFKVDGFNQRIKPGDTCEVYVSVPFQGFDIGFDAKATVLRYNKVSHELAGKFLNLNKREQEALAMFTKSILSGEMTAIDGVIRRLDLPVTPASLNPDTVDDHLLLPPEVAAEKRDRTVRLYGFAGGALALALITVLYTNFFQMKVKTAVVMGQNDVVMAPATGEVTYLASTDHRIAKGAPILSITDQKLETDIQMADFKSRDAAVELGRLDTMLDLEKKRQAAATGIVTKEQDAAAATIASLTRNLEARRATLARIEKLADDGYITRTVYDRAQGDYFDAERQLLSAKEAQIKRAQLVSTVQSGFQVRDETVEAGVHDIAALRQAAGDKLANAKLELQAMQARKERLTIKAPATGHLVRVFTPLYGSANYGEPIAVFERAGTRQVQAFLTQEEALKVFKGQQAEAYVPNRWQSIPLKVTDIDLYSLTLNESRGMLQWQNFQNDQFKTVAVTLEPADDKARKEMLKIAPGTASTVVFDL